MTVNAAWHLPLLAALALLAPAANAAERWEAAGSGAVAILPVPLKANAITGGSLHCAEQRWSLRLRTDRIPQRDAFGRNGTVDIDGTTFQAEATDVTGDTATLPVPFEVLDLLKAGNRLSVAIGDDSNDPSATFSLRGSRDVLDSIAPRCSQVDMSAFTLISLSADDPGVELAKPLLVDWARGYGAWSGRQPTYAAATLELPAGRKLLFASICGTQVYFGSSGCSLNGFAADTPGADWRQVYETEGVLLHVDPKAENGGWPNLVTLPIVNGTGRSHWIWNGSEYELRELLAAEEGKTAAQ